MSSPSWKGNKRSKRRSKAFIQELIELRKTMTWEAIAEQLKLSKRYLQKLLDEEGQGQSDTYVPRILRAWPEHTNFQQDDLQVRYA